MAKSLNKFRDSLLEQLLRLLWRQWDAVGVQGTEAPEANSIIDPEALILLTASIGRHDARLFDEALDWIWRHERLINIARLQTLLKQESFSGGAVVRAMAIFLGDLRSAAKWKHLTRGQARPRGDSEPLFFSKDSRALPIVRGPDPWFIKAGFRRDRIGLRHMTRVFDPERPANLLLRLRALFGVNSRAEVVAFLATHPYANAAETAVQTAYLRRTVYNTLVEMNLSGYLQCRTHGGENRYRLNEKQWQSILGHPLPWRNWGALFGALDLIWQKVNSAEWQEAEPLALASDLFLFVQDLVARLERSGIDTGIRPRQWSDDADIAVQACLSDLQHVFELTLG